MKIAVLGAGAMGSIYGGHLSLHNDVYMIDKKQEIVDKINAGGCGSCFARSACGGRQAHPQGVQRICRACGTTA